MSDRKLLGYDVWLALESDEAFGIEAGELLHIGWESRRDQFGRDPCKWDLRFARMDEPEQRDVDLLLGLLGHSGGKTNE